MHARLRDPNNLLILEPDLPCLVDERAEPRPDMNFKVAAFTVSVKSINTCDNFQLVPLFCGLGRNTAMKYV